MLEIDGEKFLGPPPDPRLRKFRGRWQVLAREPNEPRKKQGLQGPIDDAFSGSFLVVEPGQRIVARYDEHIIAAEPVSR